jgi:recombination protein RecT
MTAPTSQPNTQIAVVKKNIVDVIQSTVSKYVSTGELNLPADYSAGNALKSAFLILQGVQTRDNKPVLEACTPVSIHNSLYSMVVQGLNPDKKQCYFIPYGSTLTCHRSYFGAIALAKRMEPSIEDVVAEVIYQGDNLKYKIVNGRKTISDHEQAFGDENRTIVGAYAIIIDRNGNVIKTEIMTIAQIHQSWKQSRQNPFDNSGKVKPDSVHGKFPEDMAKRTAINKVCKGIINSSSDAAILGQVIRQSDDDASEASFAIEYQEHANTVPLIDVIDNETGEVVTGEIKDEVKAPEGKEETPPFSVADAPPFSVA